MARTVSVTGDVTPAERERLAKLSEEMGEAQQVIGKILLHGYVAADKDRIYDNRTMLTKEMGDVGAATILLIAAKDIDGDAVTERIVDKSTKITNRMKHQADDVIAEFRELASR